MSFIIFFLASVLAISVEVMVWRRLTPNLIAIAPCTIVVFLSALVAPYVGFVSPAPELYIILSLFFIIGTFGSLLAAFAFRNRVSGVSPLNFQARKFGWLKTIVSIFCLVAVIKVYDAYLIVGNVHDEEYSQLLSHGFAGHALVFIMMAIPLILFLRKKWDFISLVIVVIGMLLLFMRQVKSWLIIPILFCLFMYWHSGRYVFSFRGSLKLISIGLFISGLFFAVYLLGWISRTNDLSVDSFYHAVEAIAVHFLGYVVSGVLGFSEMIKYSEYSGEEDLKYLVLAIYNVSALISGGETLSAVNDNFYLINYAHDKSSNVYTLWGTLLLRTGWSSLFIYFSIIFVLTSLMVLAYAKKRIFLVYCYLISFLAVAWFEYYYYHFSVYEGIFLLLIISFFIKGIRRESSRPRNS